MPPTRLPLVQILYFLPARRRPNGYSNMTLRQSDQLVPGKPLNSSQLVSLDSGFQKFPLSASVPFP